MDVPGFHPSFSSSTTSCASFSLPQIPSSIPHLLWQLPCLKPALQRVQPPLSRKKNTPVLTCQPSGYTLLATLGGSVNTTLCFLSLHPTPRPWGKLLTPPNSFLFPSPGPTRTPNCQGSECYIPVASQATRRAPDSFVGGGGGAGRLELKVHQGSIQPTGTMFRIVP